MRLPRSPWTEAFLLWTVILMAAAIVIAIVAIMGFLRAADLCYFQMGPCSQAGDENFVRLQFAVFGIPLIWLAGVVLGVVGRALARRRRTVAR